MSFRRILTVAGVAAVGISGCGVTEHSGRVGSILSGGDVSVSLQRVDNHPPVPARDITGLSTPARGDRLVAARFRVCRKGGPAIGAYDFGLGLARGGDGRVKFPALNYPDPLEPPSPGCASGWIVFEIPATSAPSTLRFSFYDGGSNPGGEGRPRVHDRFRWAWS